MYDIALIQQYLLHKGYTKEQLSSMNDKDMQARYEELSKEFITQAKDMLETSDAHEYERQKSSQILPESLAIIGGGIEMIYTEIQAYAGMYSIKELANMIYPMLPNVKIKKIEKMVRIALCALQEYWLVEIRKHLAPMPEEERDTLLGHWDKHKDDLIALKEMYERSKEQSYIDELCHIAQMKLTTIQDYMPEELESNYKSYYNHSPEKLSMIDEALRISAEYSKQQLLRMSIKDLREHLRIIQEKAQEEHKYKALMHEYAERFQRAINDPDDAYFTNVCLDAAMELPRQKFQELAINLASQYKNFHARFDDVSKAYKDIQNLQIVF